MSNEQHIPEKVYYYFLSDWGGNSEGECEMTESEASVKNKDLEKGERFLRWVRKSEIKIVKP